MGYDLQAVIAEGEALQCVARYLPAARPASIGQGLSLMPMTDALFDSVADGSAVGALGSQRLPGGFEKALAAWSAFGPVAYVEAEYFGGVGELKFPRDLGHVIVMPRERADAAAWSRPG